MLVFFIVDVICEFWHSHIFYTINCAVNAIHVTSFYWKAIKKKPIEEVLTCKLINASLHYPNYNRNQSFQESFNLLAKIQSKFLQNDLETKLISFV